MRFSIAALVAFATCAVANPHLLLPRQDDSSCQVKLGNSFKYCSNVGCFDQASGATCCLSGATGKICKAGQSCDASGGCSGSGSGSGGGSGGGSSSSATAKDTAAGFPPAGSSITGSVTTEGATMMPSPTTTSIVSGGAGASGSSTSMTTGGASASTTPASSPSSGSSAGGSSASATPSSGDASHLRGGSAVWVVMAFMGWFL